jgi:hypothetical protein
MCAPIETQYLLGHSSNDANYLLHRTTHEARATTAIVHGSRASFTCKNREPEVADHTNGGTAFAVKGGIQLCLDPFVAVVVCSLDWKIKFFKVDHSIAERSSAGMAYPLL